MAELSGCGCSFLDKLGDLGIKDFKGMLKMATDPLCRFLTADILQSQCDQPTKADGIIALVNEIQ